MAGAGLALSASSPAGPGPDMLVGVGVSHDQMHEWPPDLGCRVVDHALFGDTDPPFTAWGFVPASQESASIEKVVWAYQAR